MTTPNKDRECPECGYVEIYLSPQDQATVVDALVQAACANRDKMIAELVRAGRIIKDVIDSDALTAIGFDDDDLDVFEKALTKAQGGIE